MRPHLPHAADVPSVLRALNASPRWHDLIATATVTVLGVE